MRAQVGVASDHAPTQVGARAHVHVVVAHGTFEERVGLHDDVGAEHGVLAEVRAGFDAAAVADDDGPVDPSLGTDLHVAADPLVLAEPEPVDVDPHVPVEDISVRADVRVESADVLPVVVGHVPVHEVTGFEQRREHVRREVDDFTLGDEVEHVGFEHVHAGVDGVGEHLTPRRLLEEPLDGPVGPRDDDAELERVVDVLQRDGSGRARVSVRLHELRQVEIGEHVARDHEERVVELGRHVAHRAGGAERRVFIAYRMRTPKSDPSPK